MIDTLLSFIAPHHCYGCGKIGQALCDNCKYNISIEPYGRCIVCEKLANSANALCSSCIVPYQRAWCVGERTDELQLLIGAFKFQNVKSAYKPLADLLDQTLPELPSNTVIIPIPTVSAHIRQRGYDHTLLISRRLADLRNLRLSPALERASSTMQRGTGRKERIRQAKKAFRCQIKLDPAVPYLLVDDVVTTGATLKFAAQTLRQAGAETVWVATVSRQTAAGRAL